MFEILETFAKRHVTPTRVMIRVLARCLACGHEQVMLKQNVDKSNNEKRPRCGTCWSKSLHRMTDTRQYRTWRGMLDRINNPHNPSFEHYGGRGIGVDPRWLSFKNFWVDMQDGYADDLTIERMDVNGDYRKENCCWATNAEQQANKRNNRIVEYRGQKMHLGEFCRVAKVGRGAITPYLNRYGSGDTAVKEYNGSSYPQHRQSRKKKYTTSSTAAPETGS